jgi:hypothetical protein
MRKLGLACLVSNDHNDSRLKAFTATIELVFLLSYSHSFTFLHSLRPASFALLSLYFWLSIVDHYFSAPAMISMHLAFDFLYIFTKLINFAA